MKLKKKSDKYNIIYLLSGILGLLIVLTIIFTWFKTKQDYFENEFPKIIITCFAGRKYNLDILLKYIDKLVELNKVDEVHLWNYTKNDEDNDYVNNLKDKYIIKHPKDKNNRGWDDYYDYYKKSLKDNDIIIKVDDDILFIDINKFDSFINERKQNDCFMLFPSIINNGVCAYYQQENNLISEDVHKFKYDTYMGDLVSNGSIANKLHKFFIIDIDEFLNKSKNINMINIKIGDRTSINFFAMLGKDFKKIIIENSDDEHWLSVECPKLLNKHNSIHMNFVVVHGAFASQRDSGLNEPEIIDLYMNLSKKMLK